METTSSRVLNKDVEAAYRKQDYTNILKKYRDPATTYAKKVLNGDILAGYKIKLACYRHLQDLQRVENHDLNFPYFYSAKECKKVLRFAKLCPDPSAGSPLPLMLWQKFILCMMAGWRDDKNHKRFIRVNLSVARTNGKTYLVNIMLWYAYMIEAANSFNQDLAYIGPVAKQAKKGWRYVKTFGNKLKEIPAFQREFFKKFDVDVQTEQVKSLVNQNNILRLSNESGQFDTYHFLFCVADEAGDPRYEGENFGKITSGQVNTPNHQFVEISTAYEDPSVAFHREQLRLEESMEKDDIRSDDDFLCLVWEQDDPDELNFPKTWLKSNPILGINDVSGLLKERGIKLNDGTINEFKNRNLNMWLQVSVNSYLKLDEINDAVTGNFDIRGRDVYIGFDSSMFSDNTALAFIFPYLSDKKEQKFYIKQHSFIPWRQAGSIEIKERQDGIRYRELAKKGFCTITKQAEGLINIEQVFGWVAYFVNHYNLNVKFFGYDRMGDFRVKELVNSLETNFDWPLQDVEQRTSAIGDPTKFLQEEFAKRTIACDADPILQKALLNATTYEDKIGMQVDKIRATYKIDVVDALIDGMYQAMWYFKDFNPQQQDTEIDRMTADQVLNWYNSSESGLLDEGDDDEFEDW